MKKILLVAALLLPSLITIAQEMNNALTPRRQGLAVIAALEAKGDQAGLETALAEALDKGLTVSEAKEALSQLYAYTGFPRSLNALGTLKKVLDARLAAGIHDNPGKDADPLPTGYDALKQGTEVQTRLTGKPFNYSFVPATDYYLKAHLFGDIFARDNMDWRTRELATIAALAARPETKPQMTAHIAIGKINGVTDAQAAAIVARVQRPAKPEQLPADWSPIPVGNLNTGFAKYFIGNSYLHKLTLDQVPAFGVTFEPGCRNNWHIHHAKTGGGQILIVTAGVGYYQEWGKPPRRLEKGDTVNIPAGVKHWHGAAPDSWFQHIALEVPGTEQSNEWCEPVDDAAYAEATK